MLGDTYDGPLTKPHRGAYRDERKAIQRARKDAEAATMRAVKAEDGHICRVPGCKSRQVEVAHEHHRGMGGNKTLDRTVPSRLITLCVAHHDMYDRVRRPDLDIVPLTERGLRGPCEYLLDGQFYARERSFVVSVTRGGGQ